MKLNRDKINYISSLIINDFKKREDIDYKVEPNDVRLEITRIITECLQVEDQADVTTRKTLGSYSNKKLREGTPEWEILYQKHYDEFMAKHGV